MKYFILFNYILSYYYNTIINSSNNIIDLLKKLKYINKNIYLLFLGYLIYYYIHVVEKPIIYSSNNLLELSKKIKSINKKVYWCIFAYNPYLQYLIYIILSRYDIYISKFLYNTIILKTLDNENLLLGYGKNNNPSGILLVFHTVYGDYTESAYQVKKISEKLNLLPISYSRRGHSLPLTISKFNTVGHPEDVDIVIKYIKSNYPNLPIYGLGLSAGSSLLARFLGNKSNSVELNGAILISPGYNFELSQNTFSSISTKFAVKKAKEHFLKPNKNILKQKNLDIYNKLLKSSSMQEWHEYQYHYAGNYSNKEDYYKDHDPIYVLEHIKIPILYINALDDIAFPKKLVYNYKNLTNKCNNKIIVHTKRGSHLGFYEGIKLESWSFKVAEEFLQLLHNKN
jgi:predicted alpha/beta-fold hydrolase